MVRLSPKRVVEDIIQVRVDGIMIVDVDLEHMVKTKPMEVEKYLKHAADLATKLVPMPELSPRSEFMVSNMDKAFDSVNETPNIGLRLISRGEELERLAVLPQVQPIRLCIHANRTYVLVGGLGGLGRSIVDLLVSYGANTIVFLSRTAPSPGSIQREFMDGLIKAGVRSQHFDIDSSLESFMAAFGKIKESFPCLSGVFHCAAVIKVIFNTLLSF